MEYLCETKNVSENVFVCSYGVQVKSFKQTDNGRKSCDTVPLRLSSWRHVTSDDFSSFFSFFCFCKSHHLLHLSKNHTIRNDDQSGIGLKYILFMLLLQELVTLTVILFAADPEIEILSQPTSTSSRITVT